ncbi:ATP synthase subunit d, mitochondrial [Melia azedarach]|uniref:ATP synthase subunit d, mitochondrial n=1 Tax=Melia azedarach TaxID=155640 RepID=A0ACC1YQJ4_MELAZ|nr:ATP synthase subunit d, mitochondrial [Melia azedarach]
MEWRRCWSSTSSQLSAVPLMKSTLNAGRQTKFSQEPEPIDWEYYRKGIGSRVVDMYKEAYDKYMARRKREADNFVPGKDK